ncbi:DedA family protein [Achromobacter seleniivolatilans]|uniref:DedA family protein n=1 Tax=Achromobacter seleniivolatilans TaxID=3047478 RepID=A0ABY9M2W7_9BURK|nr:DedA family protein [Achromobacter sp. R39]WMD21341.1 DedA family protein [Achromobacter sp. R39]
MDHYIDQIGQFIEANQVWAGPITFLLTLGESMVLLGLFIPATALMLLTGGLIGAGTLDPWGVITWGIAGAIVGDALSYWLGRWVGPTALRRWPLKQQRTGVARARLFFYRYGFASVLIGRFLGPIRSTIPTVAGVMGMAQSRFQLANVLSALLWMPLMLAPGYITARSLGTAENAQQIAMMIGAGLSVLLGCGLLLAMLRKRRQPARQRRGT